jgi:hypothetical protein
MLTIFGIVTGPLALKPYTGQNSIAPANSLPQLGQVRWGSVLMVLTALQAKSESKATPSSTDWWEIELTLANCCPVPQAIACYVIIARQIKFRNKIPTDTRLVVSAFMPESGQSSHEQPDEGLELR